MPQNLSIAIIDSDRETRETIESLILPYGDKVKLVGATGDFSEGYRLVQTNNPSVVILGVAQLEVGAEQVQHILAHFPATAIFVATTEKNPDWILRLMRSGASEYFLKPVAKTELFEALRKVAKNLSPLTNGQVTQRQGKIISVYNPVGGVGTTTIAVNLAATLAAGNDNVALVDFNLFCGDVASFLDIDPKYTLSSVTNNVNRLDADFLRASMTRHASGIYLLSEPLEVEETLSITAEQITQVLTFLKSAFSYVVIDTGGPLFGANLITFRDSDHLLFNTVLTLPALKNVRRYLAALENKGIARSAVKIVVNRYLPKADIKIGDAENVLGTKVFATIPNEYGAVIDSINKGVPVVNLYPRSPITAAIAKLITQLNS
ncbi:AAA family ATPase [Oryzomonas rubra]|uniref:Response regulator n=1 Tax=Oryzomonas rubra TaxID=2509454 RepID=A0A5A9XDM8_9BACT|nr:AAA family ATPase [Oryzomonas rubra]KAA0890458.1 response regulator [Oryzomonas rubra]